jgi:hypothetical protein
MWDADATRDETTRRRPEMTTTTATMKALLTTATPAEVAELCGLLSSYCRSQQRVIAAVDVLNRTTSALEVTTRHLEELADRRRELAA